MHATPVAVIVLAAGLGQRLSSVSSGRPKWLLEVGHETIADRQLKGFARLGEQLAGVTVVAGAALDKVAEYVSGKPVRLIVNSEYETRNNWYSALLGLEAVQSEGSGLVVIVNGDLCSTPTFFESFVRNALRCERQAVLAADLDRPLTDEAMKVSFVHGRDGTPQLTGIGKTGVPEARGEYPGVLALSSSRARTYAETLRAFELDPVHANNWYEHGIQRELELGLPWTVIPTRSSNWVEVDTPDDLVTAARLLKD